MLDLILIYNIDQHTNVEELIIYGKWKASKKWLFVSSENLDWTAWLI